MEQEIREFLNNMCAKYGVNEITLDLSRIVDKLDTKAQREKLRCLNMKSENKLQKMKQ